MSRQVYDLGFLVPEAWQRTESRRFEVGFVAHLSDGTSITSSFKDMRLFWVPGSSQALATLEALHAEVCVSRPTGMESDSLDGYWHLLGNCGYTAADPESIVEWFVG